MTYEERTSAIGTLLRNTILPRFVRPVHLDDLNARRELSYMVDDLNAVWPTVSATEFAAIGERLAKQVRQTVDGRTWPTIPRLLNALKAVKGVTPHRLSKPADAPRARPFEFNAKRIKAKEPVGVDSLYGCDAIELMHQGLVTEIELEAYREQHLFRLVKVYGEQRGLEMEAQLRCKHAAAKAAFRPADPNDDRAGRATPRRMYPPPCQQA